MKNFLSTLLISFAIPCAAQMEPHATARPLTPLEHTLIGQSETVAAAQQSKDLNTLENLLTEDFERVGSEGQLHGRNEILDDAREGALKDYRLYDFKLLPVEENVAIVTYNAVIQMPEGDEDLAPRYQHFSDVWVKQGNQWRLRFEQATARRSID